MTGWKVKFQNSHVKGLFEKVEKTFKNFYTIQARGDIGGCPANGILVVAKADGYAVFISL